MSYSQAFCLAAASRTQQTKLVHIVREVVLGLYAVRMTSKPSSLYTS